jgi:hypothetical protein
VLAITAASEFASKEVDDEGEIYKEWTRLLQDNAEKVNIVHSDTAENRWPDVKSFIDLTLVGALTDFVQGA